MRVTVVAPARRLPEEAAERVTALARRHTPRVKLAFDAQCFASHGHFAGQDEIRAEALLRAAHDPDTDAVWFARGGYGSCRLLGLVVPRLTESAGGKLYLGYSDTGYLLSALVRQRLGRPHHAPMPADVLRPGGEEAVVRVLRFLAGSAEGVEPHAAGEASFAANLSVLASLSAGSHLPDLEGCVLQIEEVSEHLYAIDRHLFTMASSGRFAGLKGVRLGRVSDVPENDVPFGEDPETMVRRFCQAVGTCYLGPGDIGHDPGNKIVPLLGRA